MATSLRNDGISTLRVRAGRPRRPRVSGAAAASSACASLNATAAPQRFLLGYGQPGCAGLMTASASGSSPRSSGRWWSVTIRSRPRARASAASATARMPVSTLMTRRTPLRCRLGEDRVLHAVALADAMRHVVAHLRGLCGSIASAMRSMVVLSRTVAVVPSTS